MCFVHIYDCLWVCYLYVLMYPRIRKTIIRWCRKGTPCLSSAKGTWHRCLWKPCLRSYVCSEPFPSCLDSNVSYPLRLQCAYNVSYPAPTMSHTLCAYSVQHSHTVAIHEICSLLLLARCKILFQLCYVWGLTLIRQVYTQEKLMNCSWLTGFRSRAQSRHHCRRRGRDVDWLHPAGLCLDGASGGYKFWAGQ